MSGQTLFELSRPEQFAQLAAVLRPLADTIEIVAYLRRPSDFYLASVQQILKADHRVKPLAAVALPRAARGLRGDRRPAARLQVRPRAVPGRRRAAPLPAERFCPELAGEDLPRLAANVSLSTEALAILAAYRRLHHADKPAPVHRRRRACCSPRSARPTARCPPRPRAAEAGGRPGGRRGLGRPPLAARRARHRLRRRRLRPDRADGAAAAAGRDRRHLHGRRAAKGGGGAARAAPSRRGGRPAEAEAAPIARGPDGERAGGRRQGTRSVTPRARRPPGWAALPARVAAFTRRAWARVSEI